MERAHDLECRCRAPFDSNGQILHELRRRMEPSGLQDQLAEIPADYGTLLSGRLPRMEPFTIESP